MSLRSRVAQLERDNAEAERLPCIIHRLEGETVEACVARKGIDCPAYVFPPPEPRDENGELAASWIAGCVRWTGNSIEPVEPGFDPRTCDPRIYDPQPDLP